MIVCIIGLHSPIDLQNKEPAHKKGRLDKALIRGAVAHTVETECTRISFGQCGEVWMGIGLFVQRIPTLAIYLENEPRKQ